LASVVVSNARLRDGAGYREDFVAFDLDRYLTGYVSSVDVGVRKPDPQIFHAAMARAGVTDTAACVMIGDHIGDDIAPALARGMRAMLVNVHGYAPEAVPAGTTVVPELSQAADALRRIVSEPSR
jgi:putative hydrolase of the HAD superfamily